MRATKRTSSCGAWTFLALLLVATVAAVANVAEEQMGHSSSSQRHMQLDVNSSPFHRVSRLLKTHSKVPEDFRKLTAMGVPTIQVDYGDLHPLDQSDGHRKTQDRPATTLNFPNGGTDYTPLRIYFVDSPIRSLLGTGSSSQDNFINHVLGTVLPDAKDLWQNHLLYHTFSTNLPVSIADCWGIYPTAFSQTELQNGLPDADVAVFVSMQRNLTTSDGTVLNVCTDLDTLVVSTFCDVDQFGRPLAGLINFCPQSEMYGTNKTARARSLQVTYPDILEPWQTSPPRLNATAKFEPKDVMTATIHQLGHILAMNYDLYRNFYDIFTASFYTPDHTRQTAVCSDNSRQIVLSPATNTLLRTTLSNNLVYFDLVTPQLKRVTQSHFNCPSLQGARLENDPSQTGCVASHFNQRLFLGEIMSHLSFQTIGAISPITLALFEDSGWYKVAYYDTYLPYGQGWGCDFYLGDCIVNDTVPDYGKGVYCSTPTTVESDGSISLDKNDVYCDPLHQKWAVCDLFDQTQVPLRFGNLNASRSWFSNTNLLSSTDGFDSCPLPILTLQVDCNDTTTSLGLNYQSEAYGASSRCINAEMTASKRKLPACFNVTCDAKNFQVLVNGIKCKYDGEVHTIKTIHGATASFECPRISLVCPQLFCPSDCSGQGTCDYSKKPPQCKCLYNITTPNCQNASAIAPPPSTPGPASPTLKPMTKTSSTSSAFRRSMVTTWLWMWCFSATLRQCSGIR